LSTEGPCPLGKSASQHQEEGVVAKEERRQKGGGSFLISESGEVRALETQKAGNEKFKSSRYLLIHRNKGEGCHQSNG